MQRRILVPLDGSVLADRIASQVRRLLVAEDAEVVLLSVVDPRAASDLPLERRVEDARDHLGGIRDALVERGATASFDVVVGSPVEAIVEQARRRGVELVVMATHGRTGLARLARGSVAESVMRQCPVPVLVANPRALDAAGPEARFGRLLVPLDGSELALGILPTVQAIARRYESEVLLLRVEWTVPTTNYPLDVSLLRPPHEIEATLEPQRQALQAAGIRARCVAAYGPEGNAILDVAEREDVDLVAMSTHGRTGLARVVFGSVAEHVLRHCGRPLLVRRVLLEPAAARPPVAGLASK